VAIFIALFLYLFKPFGLHNAPDLALEISFKFGLVTFFFSAVFDLLVRYVFRLKTDAPSWTFAKWILLSMLTLCWIAFGNFLLMVYEYGGNIASLGAGFVMLKYTLMLGILPVFVSGLFVQMNAIKANQTQAKSLKIPVYSENSGDYVKSTPVEVGFDLPSGGNFRVSPADILCVEAMQNYVLMHYQTRGEYQTQIIRSTLAQVLQRLLSVESEKIMRCHRSYLVNLLAVKDIQGNAQGLKLTFDNAEDGQLTVPVSRSYLVDFKTAIAKIK
jgi:hypothetical protein